MYSKNKFSQVENAISMFENAKLYAYNKYEKRLKLLLGTVLILVLIFCLASSIAYKSEKMFYSWMAIAISLRLYLHIQNWKYIKFIRELIVSIIWYSEIREEAAKTKLEARANLQKLEPVIKTMLHTGDWKIIAKKADRFLSKKMRVA